MDSPAKFVGRFDADHVRNTGRWVWPGDTLVLLFLCCHPAVSPAAQIALTLRAVGGLTTAEIARALLLPEPTIAQRISRAKRRILDAGGRFRMPDEEDRARRLDVVLHVLYLIFNEGYTATAGDRLQRTDLCVEAIRLARMTHRLVPDIPEVGGLHAEAERFADTDWAQIVALYEVLDRLASNPMVTLNRAVAVAMLRGPVAGLSLHDIVSSDERMHGHHRVPAVRAHLLEDAGAAADAIAAYRTAARLTTSMPERRYLLRRAARLQAAAQT